MDEGDEAFAGGEGDGAVPLQTIHGDTQYREVFGRQLHAVLPVTIGWRLLYLAYEGESGIE